MSAPTFILCPQCGKVCGQEDDKKIVITRGIWHSILKPASLVMVCPGCRLTWGLTIKVEYVTKET